MNIDPSIVEPRHSDLGGLVALAEGAERPLPLRSVRVRADIIGIFARVTVEQVFANALTTPMDVVHIFPLPPSAAVTALELRAGDRVVHAECRQREEAERVFEDARRHGHQAGLLTEERDDVHTLHVANLPAGAEVRVKIVLVQALKVIDGLVRWHFPTVIAPRYLPGQATGYRGRGVLPDTTAVPDASGLQPPLLLEGGAALDLEVTVQGPVRQLASSLHAVRVDLGDAVRVAPSGRAGLDRDFILGISTATEDVALRAWTDGSHTLVQVDPPAQTEDLQPREAVFLVDISGSMRGSKMEAAKMALRTALHGLNPGDRCRLIAFDSVVEPMTPDAVNYDDASLAEGDRWIDGLHARGGTEMLPAIQEALRPPVPEGFLRTVLFITDGQSWDEARLAAAVMHRRNDARFFSLGIDSAVNSSLLERLARVGGGTCTLLTPQDDIEAAVARLEGRIGSPVMTGVKVKGYKDMRPIDVFADTPDAVLVPGAPDPVKLKGHKLKVHPQRVDFDLGALWARQEVLALEDRVATHPHQEEGLRAEIIRVSLAHQIASRFTAFVAVDETVTVDGPSQVVVQPVSLPHAWEDPALDDMELPSPAPMRGMRAAMMPASAPSPRSPRRVKKGGKRKMSTRAKEAMARAVAVGGAPVASATPPDVARDLAQGQDADGSFGGDLHRTLAALLALVLLGHTRRKGLRRRAVAKAARWLDVHGGATARPLLDWLDRIEAGEQVPAPAGIISGQSAEAQAARALLP